MATQELNLINTFKILTGNDNIITNSNNTILFGNVTNLSFYNIFGNAKFVNNVTVNTNCNILNNMIIQNNTSILSNLFINNDSLIYGSCTVYGNINITNNALIGNNLLVNNNLLSGNISINNSLNVQNNTIINNGINTNTIIAPSVLNITGYIINIGNNINSNVNFNGLYLYEATNQLIVIDKLISLNLNYSTLSGFDNGSLSGIYIYSTKGSGFIQTTTDGTKFQIKAPYSDNIDYINTLDMNNNLIVSGTTLFLNNISYNSSLFISGNTLIGNNSTILSNLSISNNTIFQNSLYINSNFSAINANLQSDISIGTNLYIGNNLLAYNTSILSNIFISNTILNNATTILGSLTISGASIFNTLLGNSLYVSNYSIFNNLTLLSNLYSSNNSILNNTTILSNLITYGPNVINNISVLSNLFITSNATIKGNATFGTIIGKSSVTNFNVQGIIVAPLTEYLTNSQASLYGVPLWGFYRTGGIIKIRLDNSPPIITLNGYDMIYVELGDLYIDPGVTAIDFIDNTVLPYISLIEGNNISLSLNILANSQNDLTALLNTNIQNTFTITYTAIDSSGNLGINTRQVIINKFTTFIDAYTIYDTTSSFNNIINNNYNLLNNNDFTVECWVYLTKYLPDAINLINLFDQNSKIIFLINSIGNLGIHVDPSYQINITTQQVPLNIWTHIVWMRYSNNLYGFINGIISLASSVDSSLNLLSNINTLNIGNSLYGSISQVTIRNIAFYNISNFISVINLKPLNNTNLLFSSNNNQDIITTTQLSINGNILIGNRYTSYTASYDISNGGIGPLIGTFTSYFINNFTFEIWIYLYNYNNTYSKTIILDTRDPLNTLNDGKYIFSINSLGYPQIEYANTSWITSVLQTVTPIPINRWSHVVWMKKDNYFYNFINGIAYNGIVVNTAFNSLSNINNISFMPVDQISTSTAFRIQGQISQPKFSTTSIYNPTVNFIPLLDLTPSIIINILFFINYNITDIISSQILSISNKVLNLQRYYLNNNLKQSTVYSLSSINWSSTQITPLHSYNNYVTAYNFNNGWLGKEIKDFTSVFYGTNDYTVETWIYINYVNPQNNIVLIDFRDPSYWDSVSGNSGWLGPSTQTDGYNNKFYFGIANGQLILWYNTTGNFVITTQTIKYNSWNHIVYMRKGNNYYGFINGYYDIVKTDTNNLSSNLTNLFTIILGRSANYTSANHNYQFNGYLSQVLIRTGAQYNLARFTPKIDLSSLANGNTVFYLNQNYTDISNNVILPLRFSVPQANRYTSYILAYDTTNGSLGPLAYNFNILNNNNWTIEAWIYIKNYGSSSYSSIIDFRNSTSSATSSTISICITLNGYPGIYVYGGTGLIILSDQAIRLNEWTHIVWFRLNNILSSYINGIQTNKISITNDFNNFVNMSYITIGTSADQIIPNTRNYQFNGYINQIKIYLGPVYDPPFIPSLDLSIINTTNNNLLFFLNNDNTDNVTGNTLTINSNIYYIYRSLLPKWITTYNNTNIFYRYNNFSLFDSATSWTCEGWIYITSLVSTVINILSTSDLNNYNILNKIEFGYKSNYLFINSSNGYVYSTTGLYSNSGLQANRWNHFAFVKINTSIYFYINGIQAGSTSNIITSNTSIIQINGSPNNPLNLNFNMNQFAQISLALYAKYTSEFIPEPDLISSNLSNYLTFLGNNGDDLVDLVYYNSYNNTISKTRNLIPF